MDYNEAVRLLIAHGIDDMIMSAINIRYTIDNIPDVLSDREIIKDVMDMVSETEDKLTHIAESINAHGYGKLEGFI